MQVKVDTMELAPGEVGHFKIKVLPQNEPGEATVYLLIHDSIDQKLCIILNLI